MLVSLNDVLEKSGQAIQQFVTHGAIGEGYAWPTVNNGVIELDKNKLNNFPVTSIQIEFNSPALIGSFYAMGRPITYQDLRIQPARHLLPRGIRTPIPNAISKQQSGSHRLRAVTGQDRSRWLRAGCRRCG